MRDLGPPPARCSVAEHQRWAEQFRAFFAARWLAHEHLTVTQDHVQFNTFHDHYQINIGLIFHVLDSRTMEMTDAQFDLMVSRQRRARALARLAFALPCMRRIRGGTDA